MKNLRKLLALTMMLAMLLPSVGQAASNFGRFDETVSVSFMGCDWSTLPYDSNNPERRSATENAYINGYLEYMNIKVERIVPEDTTALNALINTGMAGGTLPDFIEVDRNMFFVMAENGVLQDLTPAYEKYAEKNQIKTIVESFPDRIATGYYDGQWLGIPVGQLYHDAHVLWVRNDWLKKVGLELPKTIDDVITVARAFKEAKLGGEKTVPLGMIGYTAGAPCNYGDPASFISGFGITPYAWVQREDGTYEWADASDKMKEPLLVLQSLYREGLIKSDFAVTNILDEEVSNGTCGMFYGPGWLSVTNIQTNLNSDPEASWSPVLLPSVTGEPVAQMTKALPSNYLVATTNCKNPEALFMLAEFGLGMKYAAEPEESLRFSTCEDGYTMHNLSVTRSLIRPDEGLISVNLIKEGIAQHADTIVKDTGIPRSTLYNWLKQHREKTQQKSSTPILTQRLYHNLENKVKRLEGIIEILKTIPCTVHAPLQERMNEIEKLQDRFSIHMLCDAMDVARGTFYNHILRNKRDDAWFVKRREDLRLKIQEIYDGSNQILGAKKIAAVMKNQGIRVSKEMVSQLMHEMGLVSIRQGSKKLYDKEISRGKNHLNQQFDVQKPNQVWCSDITLFNYKQKNYYICVIMDLFARKIVGYMVSHRNSTHLVKMTFQKAYKERQPEAGLVFHTDRGSNYRSNAIREYLTKLGVTQSFSRPYTPYDNSVMESFFSSMKREELYRTKYKSERELREAIDAYMLFYNEQRPHAKAKYKTPNQAEAEYAENIVHLDE